MARSSRGEDARFSFWKQGFDSPTGYKREFIPKTQGCSKKSGPFLLQHVIPKNLIYTGSSKGVIRIEDKKVIPGNIFYPAAISYIKSLVFYI